MGLTIHYRGHIDSLNHVPSLSEKLIEFAEAMGWRSETINDDWEKAPDANLEVSPEGANITGHLGLRGVTIIPEPKGESLSFFFDRKGALRSLMGVISILDGSMEQGEAWVSVKTQFASPQFHTWVVGLLKYLKKSCISDLEVNDEGEYWESGDLEKLKGKMAFLDEKMNYLANRLNSGALGDTAGLSADEIASRFESFFRESDNDNNNV